MKVSEAKYIVMQILKNRVDVVPFLLGESGIGKSAVMHQAAMELGFRFVDLRLAQMEPGDAIGLPRSVFENGRWVMKYAAPFWFPFEDAEPTVIFLDELPQAPRDVQTAFFQFIYDRELMGNVLHEKHRIVAAGNPAVGNYESMELGTALRTRLAIFKVESSLGDWLSWSRDLAETNPQLKKVREFLSTMPHMFHRVDHTEIWDTNQKPDPRAWVRLSELLNACEIPEHLFLEVAASMVGKEAAIAYSNFLSELKMVRPVTAVEIFESPGYTEEIRKRVLESTVDALNETKNSIVQYADNEDNIEKIDIDVLCDVMEDIPNEFKVVLMRNLVNLRSKNLNQKISESDRIVAIMQKTDSELKAIGTSAAQVAQEEQEQTQEAAI